MLDFAYVSSDGSEPDLNALINAGVLAVDAETSGVSTVIDVPYGFSIAADDHSAYFSHMHNRLLTDLLDDDGRLKIAHNAKFDRSMFKKYGVEMNNLCCTMIAAHLLEESRLSLSALLKRFLKYDMDIHFFPEYQKKVEHSSLYELARFFGPHSTAAFTLWRILQRELRAEGLWDVFWNIEMPTVPVLSDMELNGALIDAEELKRLGTYYDERMEPLHEGLKHLSGHTSINWNSPDQVAEYLYGELKITPLAREWTDLYGGKHKSSGDGKRPSVDRKILEPYKGRYSIVSVYLAWKSYRHLKDTYVTGILNRMVNGRIHTNFNQTRTRTGRLSSSDPNLQNIPKRTEEGRKIRRAFIAPEGKKIVVVDYDQMELRDMAIQSKCKPLLDAFRSGRDVHAETAVRVFGDTKFRMDGKTLNFQIIYGGGEEKRRSLFFEAYPEVKTWTDKVLDVFMVLGCARTLHGRKRHLGPIDKMVAMDRAHAHREGISTIVQGSCSEVTKIGMANVWRQIHNSDIKMLLQVHDELVFEVPHADIPDFIDMARREMTYTGLEIPLTVSISVGKSWGEAHEVKQ